MLYDECCDDCGIEELEFRRYNKCDDNVVRCKAINLGCSGRTENAVQCKGIASNGGRCGNNTLNACGYCHLHTGQAPPAGRCLNQTTNASGYCDYHKNNWL